MWWVEDSAGSGQGAEVNQSQGWKTVCYTDGSSCFGQQEASNRRSHGIRFPFTKVILVRTNRYLLGGYCNNANQMNLNSKLDLQI